MARDEWERVNIIPTAGVNERAEFANPLTELEVGRNVWAPDGRLVTRPGFEGVHTICNKGYSPLAADVRKIFEDVSTGIFTVDANAATALSGLAPAFRTAAQAGDRIYLGSATNALRGLWVDDTAIGIGFNVNCWGVAHYWNGSTWKPLPVQVHSADNAGGREESNSIGPQKQGVFRVTQNISFVPPNDWAQNTVQSLTKYWIRITLVQSQGSSSDAAAEVGPVRAIPTTEIGWLFSTFAYGAGTPYLVSVYSNTNSLQDPIGYEIAGAFPPVSWHTTDNSDTGGGIPTDIKFIKALSTSSYSVSAPEVNLSYIVYGNSIYETYRPATARLLDLRRASLDNTDAATGPGAAFDKEQVVLLSDFPHAKYLMFSGQRLWAAGIEQESQFTVRWSAATPYHRVWPALSYEELASGDPGPVTALNEVNGQTVVFKSDSIWIMEPAEENPVTLTQHYTPRLVVNGVGCVSHTSVAAVRGGLIFLAEDGVYVFAGTPPVTKLSDRIAATIKDIDPSRRHKAVGINWKKQGLYLLSVPIRGEEGNSKTLVYDYINNAWWIWDGFDAQQWFFMEDVDEKERLYFVDSNGHVYAFDQGATDHGAIIEAEIKTHRLYYRAAETRTLRAMRMESDNKSREFDVTVYAEDEPTGSAVTVPLTDTTNEQDWSGLLYPASGTKDSYVTYRRRMNRADFRETGKWFQIKVIHDQKYQKMALGSIQVATDVVGIRE